MSNLRVNTVRAVNDVDKVSFPAGASISGILEIAGISASGVITATSISAGALNSLSFPVDVPGVNASGIVTATAFSGDGSQITNVVAAVPGGFNVGISSCIVYDVPGNTPGVAFSVAPGVSTTTKYLLHSIHLTNVSASDATVTSTIYSSEYSLGYQVPMPQRSSVELLRQPKLLTAGEWIKLGANNGSTIKAVITLEGMLDSAGVFFGDGVTLTNEDQYYDVFDPTAGNIAPSGAMLKSFNIANRNEIYDSRVTVIFTDQSDVNQGYLAYELIVPANSTVELFDKEKFVPPHLKIKALSTVSDEIDITYVGRRVTPVL